MCMDVVAYPHNNPLQRRGRLLPVRNVGRLRWGQMGQATRQWRACGWQAAERRADTADGPLQPARESGGAVPRRQALPELSEERVQMPFLIREHERKFAWAVSECTVWRRK